MALALASVSALSGAAPAAADHPGKLVQGTVVTDHADDFRKRKPLARPLFTLRTKRTERRLRFKRAVSRKRLRVRSTVRVRGRVKKRSIDVRRLGKPRRRLRARAADVQSGPRKTAVVLIRFSGGSPNQFSPAAARAKVFGDPESTNAYFQEASDGDVSLVGHVQPEGDVFGAYTVTRGSGSCDNSYAGWRNSALYQAVAGGLQQQEYDHLVYVLPPGSGCAWSGLAAVGGNWSMLNDTLDTWVVAHELGHNMDLDHAAADTCLGPGWTVVPLSADCSSDEYGDPYDVMGNHGSRLFNAAHRLSTGWLLGSQSRTISQNGTFSLDALYDSNPLTLDTGTRVLRVRRPDGRELHLEVRRPFGLFDDYSGGSAVVNGLSVRIDRGPLNQGYDDRTTHLLDMGTSTTNYFYDSALPIGQTFTDPISTTSITLNALGPSGATVSVDLTGSGPDRRAPGRPTRVTAATAAPGQASLTWTASADNIQTTAYDIYRGGALIGTSPTASFTDTSLPAGTPTYTVRARDAAGNVSLPSGPATLDGPPSVEPEEPVAPPGPTNPGPGTNPPTSPTSPPPSGTKRPVAVKPVSLVPVRAVMLSRSRARGSVARLARADGRAMSVRGRRGLVRFEARFARVPSRSGRLKLTLRARGSTSCRGRAEIYVPGSRRWVRLGKVSLGRRSRTLSLRSGAAGSRYVSRGRVVKVRVSCASRRLRTVSADLLRLTAS